MPWFMIASFAMPMSLQPGDDALQIADEFPPAVHRPLIIGFLVGTEAGLLHAHERSAACRDQCPYDDALKPHRAPAIGELFIWFDDQDFGIDHAVPIGHRCGAETEFMAHNWLEVAVHQPLLDQMTLR